MDSIITYLSKFKDKTFDDYPFSSVDSLVLSQLSYLIYDGIIKNYEETHEIKEFKTLNNEATIKKLTDNTLEPKKNVVLLKNLFQSKRFEELKIGYYHSLLCYNDESQFAAMVFILPKNDIYIAFRGTDVTFLGWKEDFNMAFMDEIPGQKYSVEYINNIFSIINFDISKIYVGGHSKGGNLALYASIFCKKEYQDRITMVFDHDGPGFKKHVFELEEFKNIGNKINKTIPYDSWIGIILNYYKNAKIIKASGVGIFQHDPFNWKIENGDFIYLKERSKGSVALEKALYTWILDMDEEKRKELIELVYDLVESDQFKNVTDFKKETLKKIGVILKKYNSLEKEDRIIIKNSFKKFMVMYWRYRIFKTLNDKKQIQD